MKWAAIEGIQLNNELQLTCHCFPGKTNKQKKLKLVATVQAVEMVDEKRISLSDATEAVREISWPRELRKEKEL